MQLKEEDEDPNYPRLPRSPPSFELSAQATDAPIEIPVGRNWNEEYQQLLQDASTNAPSLERITQLRKLCEEFASSAKRIGTIILSELFLSPQKPITQLLGGIAGGEKYIHEGIFFKLAVDKRGLYGGDEGIMKAAGHEMRSLMSCLDCRIQGLHFPLILLVDYRGHRLIAESLLPIGGDTLIYGSSDSGTDIRTSNSEMNARMELVGKILNLRGDDVSNWDKTTKTRLYGPIDIEGHQGRDDRFYLVDTARLFPPAAAQESVRGGFLYRLLRPELVKSNAVPLSSNALSNWTMDDGDKADQDVREATRRLHEEVVPSFAKFLDEELSKSSLVTSEPLRVQLQSLLTEMHRRGINVRLMGLLRSFVTAPSIRMLLLTDIIARTVKNHLRAQMRKLRSPDEVEYRALIIKCFNVVFGRDDRSRIHWTIELKDSVQRYRFALSHDEQSVLFDLRTGVYIFLLFQRVQEMFGVRFRKATEERILDDLHAFDPLVLSDLEEHTAVVNFVHRIHFEEATAIARQASKTGAAELLRIADEKYNASVQQKPDDYRSLHNWGLSLMLQALSKENKGEEAEALFKLAASKFHAALAMDPRDYRALFLWANMLSEQSRFKEGKDSRNLLILACAKYQKAHNIDPNNFEVLYNWGNALLYRAKSEDDKELLKQAAEKYELATKLKPKSHKCLRNWAVAVAKLARLSEGEAADALFTKAGELSKIRPSDWEVLFNWGNTLYRWARVKERDGDHKRALKRLRSASEKYVSVLDIEPANADALHNWGKVLYSQGTLMQKTKAKEQLPEFCRQVEVYLELFSTFACTYSAKVSLKALIALAQLKIPAISGAVCSALQRLNSAPDSKLRANAAKTLQMFLNEGSNPNPNTLSVGTAKSNVPENISRIVRRLSNTEVHHVSISDFEVLRAAKHEEDQQEREFHVRLSATGQRFYLRIFSYESIGQRLGRPVDAVAIDTILASLAHPYITSFDFVIHSGDTCFLVYDTLNCVPMRKLAGEDGRLTEEQLRSFMAEAVLAVSHFHEKGFVYKYLRTDDLLVDPEGHLSLSRFAFHRPTAEYSFDADWVALGRSAFELLSGVRDKTALAGLQVKFSPAFLSFAKALLGKVLKSGAEIRAHPFFSQVQWEVFESRQVQSKPKPKLPLSHSNDDDAMHQYDTTNFEAAPTLVAKLKKSKFRGFTYVQPSK